MMKNALFFISIIISLVFVSKTVFRITPDIITEKTKHDTDDPAIWVNHKDPEKSIVFGTDKDSDGAIYAFDLEGKIIKEKTIKGLKRPNNVDLQYNFKLNDSVTVDVLAFTEREKNQIRIFSVPDMKPLDIGGLPVFEDETNSKFRIPMGISLYSSPIDNALYAIVSRKYGPEKNYLYQYEIKSDGERVSLELVRKFGNFSGKQEIEAVAVDNELGYIYYSDESHCIRKYFAEPSKGNKELGCFGGDIFEGDIEGIAIANFKNGTGYIIVSNQKKGTFNIFSRKNNEYVREINLNTNQTDGCEIVTIPLNKIFKNGLFVAMNNERNFYFYDLGKLGLD
jgi:3-phytase